MIRLRHGTEPDILREFREQYSLPLTSATWEHFKIYQCQQRAGNPVVQTLHDLQEGLCVYCERKICNNNNHQSGESNKRQHHVEHIRCKGNPNYQHLVVTYSNLALSCTSVGRKSTLTCGMRKGKQDLPIIPTDEHEHLFDIDSENGEIIPVGSLSPADKKKVEDTVRILNLNQPELSIARKKLIDLFKSIQNEIYISEAEKHAFLRKYAEMLTARGEEFAPTLRRFLANFLE